MAGQRHILRRGAEFHRHADFMDHVACTRPDDMGAKDAVCGGIGQQFHKALGLKHRLGAGIAHEGEAPDLQLVTGRLGPGLGQMLDTGRQLGDMSLVLGSIIVIMIVGVLIERLVFSPIRQRTLRNRGLVVAR